MHFPVLTLRRCIFIGLMLASLVVLADSVAQNEVQKAMSDMALAMSGAAPDGASK